MNSVIATIVVAVLSLIGTCVGSIAGILTANKLTNYRIEQLEKKVDKMNDNFTDINERLIGVESDQRVIWKAINELKEIVESMRKEH